MSNLNPLLTIMTKFSYIFLTSFWMVAVASASAATQVALSGTRWLINGQVTHSGTVAEGLLMNVRMVNATFEDRGRPGFAPEANAAKFIARIREYTAHGVDAFTLNLQGGMPGYEGVANSAFERDGSLRADCLERVERVIRACDSNGVVVILGLYYQRQSKALKDEAAVRAGVVNAARWIRSRGFQNVVVEVANEYPHSGFVHPVIRDPKGQASLIRLVKETVPGLLVTASGYGDGKVHPEVAEACDFLTPHWNGTKVEDIPARVAALKRFGKPIVCNEDDKTGERAVAALRACVENGCAYGLMLKDQNQTFPFHFEGAADDPVYYAALKAITSGKALPAPNKTAVRTSGYFPPPESQGGWRMVETEDEIETIGGMDKTKIAALREWLLKSDNRPFAAVVIRHGTIVLQVERGNSAATDSRRVASCSKAVCATVLAIASEWSQQGRAPRRMTFEDKAFEFIPWAQPLSDPRKARVTVKQLLNHRPAPRLCAQPRPGDHTPDRRQRGMELRGILAPRLCGGAARRGYDRPLKGRL